MPGPRSSGQVAPSWVYSKLLATPGFQSFRVGEALRNTAAPRTPPCTEHPLKGVSAWGFATALVPRRAADPLLEGLGEPASGTLSSQLL